MNDETTMDIISKLKAAEVVLMHVKDCPRCCNCKELAENYFRLLAKEYEGPEYWNVLKIK